MILTMDFETRSSYRWPEVKNNLRQFGSYEYARHAEVLMLAVAVDDEDPRIWSQFMDGMSGETLKQLINSADEIHAHNIQFERAIWREQMVPRGFPDLPLEKCYCTAALAASYALPRSLDGASRALGLPVEKDKAGYALMMRMCKPRRPKSNEDPNGIYWHESPEDFARLAEYCKQDVRTERAISKALPRRETPTERKIWILDQMINDRGLHIDRAFCAAAVRETEAYTAHLMRELATATGGELSTISASSPEPLRYLAGRGVNLPDLTSATVDEALAAWVEDDAARRVLEIRQSLGKSSVSKYQTMLDTAGKDGRVRGALLYHGAATGRWSGKLIQPQNFPRGSLKLPQVEETIAEFQATGWEWLGMDPMHAASSCLRGAICAAPGNVLYCADFSNIEGRLQAWLSGEDWKVEAFKAYDKKEGPDLYKKCVADLLGLDIARVTKDQRQIGKTCIAEGEMILTDSGLKPIEKLSLDDRVWDGVEWVEHAGVVCNGEREVFTYDGLTATGDHVVFTEDGREVPFWQAASKLEKIARTEVCGQAVRYGGDNLRRDKTKGMGPLCPRPLRRVWGGEVDKQRQPFTRKNAGVSVLFAEDKPQQCCTGGEVPGVKKPVHEPEGSGVQKLRSPGDTVRVFQRERVYPVDGGELAAQGLQRARARSHRQQRALCARELEACDACGEQHEQATVEIYELQNEAGSVRPCVSSCSYNRPEHAVLQDYSREVRAQGLYHRADNPPISQRPKLQTKRVYDVANAGPRNRFTVSGHLVHNCELSSGYQGGIAALVKGCATNRISPELLASATMATMTDPEEKERSEWIAGKWLEKHPGELPLEIATALDVIKSRWRKKHPAIVNAWRGVEEACILTTETGKTHEFLGVRFGLRDGFLLIKLPSGRCIAFYAPRVVEGDFSKRQLTFLHENSLTRKWCRKRTYGGDMFQSIIQAIARDVMAESMLRVEAAGYGVVATVHDEVLSETPEKFGSLVEFERLMADIPLWASGFPNAVEGWTGKRYRKG